MVDRIIRVLHRRSAKLRLLRIRNCNCAFFSKLYNYWKLVTAKHMTKSRISLSMSDFTHQTMKPGCKRASSKVPTPPRLRTTRSITWRRNSQFLPPPAPSHLAPVKHKLQSQHQLSSQSKEPRFDLQARTSTKQIPHKIVSYVLG